MDKLLSMASGVPIFFDDVQLIISWTVLFVCLAVEIVAFVNCLTQRAEAFPVVGSLTKQAWLAILGGCVLASAVCGVGNPLYSIFGFVAIIAASIYLLDVRPALRDATNGPGSW